jgi:hypothetical protein
MQRWASTLVGLAVVVLALWLVVHDFQPPAPVGHIVETPFSVGSVDSGAAAVTPDAGVAPIAATTAEDAGMLLLSDLASIESDRRGRGGIGSTMLDGTPVPPLPVGAPREVRFGVVLVSYTGAQPSVVGGRPPSRSREEAKALARKLLTTAQSDFHAAVQQGDAGSSEDVGRVKLGILEPAPEYVLFTLSSGGVAGPIDTPRGYWIVKRLD